jgi:hypothetical protein
MRTAAGGRIWLVNGRGSLSGQNMRRGFNSSLEIFCTRPPVANLRPDGVRRAGILAAGIAAAAMAAEAGEKALRSPAEMLG